MEYRFNFVTEDDREQLIKDNLNLTLIKIAYHLGESYLVFTDDKIEYELSENEILANKISILEVENKTLRDELTQIQASIASLTSLITATLEEK